MNRRDNVYYIYYQHGDEVKKISTEKVNNKGVHEQVVTANTYNSKPFWGIEVGENIIYLNSAYVIKITTQDE